MFRFVKKLLLWPLLQFTGHEAWALKFARDVPFVAPFVFGTLWLWIFGPGGILGTYMIENADAFGEVFLQITGAVGTVAIAPWFFRWAFICNGLMIGRTKMAQSKEQDISARLEWLTRSQDVSDGS